MRNAMDRSYRDRLLIVSLLDKSVFCQRGARCSLGSQTTKCLGDIMNKSWRGDPVNLFSTT